VKVRFEAEIVHLLPSGDYWIVRWSLSSGRPSAGPVGGRWHRGAAKL